MTRIKIIRQSITDVPADAIVNAANGALQAGGGVCGAIFSAAGFDELQAACDRIGHCDTGSAAITPGFKLKAKHIIHAVGPIWQGGSCGEPELLYGAYHNSLKLAAENGCRSICFPLISAGIYGYPARKAWEQALLACRDFLQNESSEISIIFAVLDDDIMRIGNEVLAKIISENLRKETSIYYDGCYPVDLDRPRTLADIEFEKKLDAALAKQQEEERKAKKEKSES